MENTITSHLKDLKLYEENGQYYLDATYVKESLNQIAEIHVPKIQLPFISSGCDTITINQGTYCNIYNKAYIEVGIYTFPIEKVYETKHAKADVLSDNGVYYTWKFIDEKTKEMTLEEIEQKFGHKIKLVSKIKED